MTDSGDYAGAYQDRDERRCDSQPPWPWIILLFVVALVVLTFAFIVFGGRQVEQPNRITPIPSASQTMTVTETPATVTETPPVTLTETKTETSPTTVVVTRTEPVTTTVTVTP